MKKSTAVFSFILLCASALAFGQSRYYERVEKEFDVNKNETLEVILTVDAGEVRVEKARSGDATARVYIKYTRDEFRHDIDFSENRNRLHVKMKKDDWKSWSDHRDRNLTAEVTIELPENVDIILDTKLKAGEMEMDLGGLSLLDFTLYNLAGEVDVRFDEPNPKTMRFMDVDAKVGEMRLTNLGNARFERADINAGIGELDVDFSGDILNESMAKVDLDIGEATVVLPRDIGVQMTIAGGFSFLSEKQIDHTLYKEGRHYYSEGFDDADQRFFVRITPGLGELNVER